MAGSGLYDVIVAGTDGSPTAARAVEDAVRLAAAAGARLELVAAYTPPHRAGCATRPKMPRKMCGG